MISAVRAVRDHSSATKGSHQAVLLALASFADKDGKNAFPSYDTLQAAARCGRARVAAALKEAEENADIECTGKRRSGTRIYSFATLIARASSSTVELRDGSTVELRQGVSETGSSISADLSSKSPTGSSISADLSSTVEPDQVDQAVDQGEEKNSRGGLSLLAEIEQQRADEDRSTLAALLADRSLHPVGSSRRRMIERSIQQLRDHLAIDIDAEIDRHVHRMQPIAETAR
ncbi:MAG: helix-turn-helix domain-containing protein [Actinobacteria bacterium]|nr:helix-turn-helix domain-containing protein [Actinomycetota bacterium]